MPRYTLGNPHRLSHHPMAPRLALLPAAGSLVHLLLVVVLVVVVVRVLQGPEPATMTTSVPSVLRKVRVLPMRKLLVLLVIAGFGGRLRLLPRMVPCGHGQDQRRRTHRNRRAREVGGKVTEVSRKESKSSEMERRVNGELSVQSPGVCMVDREKERRSHSVQVKEWPRSCVDRLGRVRSPGGPCSQGATAGSRRPGRSYRWNGEVSDDKLVRSAVMWGFLILPVYYVGGLADLVVLNPLDYWQGVKDRGGQRARRDGTTLAADPTKKPGTPSSPSSGRARPWQRPGPALSRPGNWPRQRPGDPTTLVLAVPPWRAAPGGAPGGDP